MKHKLINLLLKLDDKSVVTVFLTIDIIVLLLFVITVIVKLSQHQDAKIEFANVGVWFWLTMYTFKSYQLRKAQAEIQRNQIELGRLLGLFMMLKDANSHGISIQDLERRGLLRMEIIPISNHPVVMPVSDVTPEDREAIEEIIRRKLTKKEKLVN